MPAGKKSPYLSDIWSSYDALSFDTFKPALMQIIEQAETPLTVGVFGTWGSGKTTLLRMLKSEIDSKGLQSFKSIWFTAWKYEQQEALWRSFILRVIDGLYPKDENGNRYSLDQLVDQDQRKGAEELERLERSVYETVNWEDMGSWGIDVGELAKQGIHLPIWLAFHLAHLGGVGKDLGINPNLTTILEREVREHHLNQLVSMEQFEATFQKAIKLILGDEGRLVVFVDDLDRCLPEKSVEVLEAIKLFLDVPGTVFVLGMDREVIRRGIESHYGALLKSEPEGRDEIPINGEVYLQKMIQLPFNLPPLDVNARNEFIEKLEDTLPADFHLDEVTRQVFAQGLYPNPRQVKRALNVFFLLKNIALEQEERKLIPLNVLAWPLLAKTVLIQSQWPELYQLWRLYPTLIQTLEDEYTRQPISEDELLGIQQFDNIQPDSGLLKASQPRSKDRSITTGLIAPFLNERQKYALLAELLRYPDEIFTGRYRARFGGLKRKQIQIYVGLVGSVEQITETVTVSMPENIIQELQSGDTALIREILAVVKEKEPDGQGPQHKDLANHLMGISRSRELSPKNRAAAADALDELGSLPVNLYSFMPIMSSSIDRSDLFLIGTYPVTNVQYARYLKASDFGKQEFWMDFPMFDENGTLMKKTWGKEGWEWFQKNIGKSNVITPRYWNDVEFGKSRPSAPIVGISWYEANAYAKWLLNHWYELDEGKQGLPKPKVIRLPIDQEWSQAAGGDENKKRYAWDRSEVTTELSQILQRSNISESQIGRTTPVWMYPLGISPQGVMDMSGNTFEWQANYWDKDHVRLSLRGGSWNLIQDGARVAFRNGSYNPYQPDFFIGFRVCLRAE